MIIPDYWKQFLLISVLNLIDFSSTFAIYTIQGEDSSVEANPWLRHNIDYLGFSSILWHKIMALFFLSTVLLFFVAKSTTRVKAFTTNIICYANIAYSIVVGWGLYCLVSIIRL